MLTRRVFPQGNELLHRYDDSGPRATQRNLLELRRRAEASRGGGEDLVTTMTYEPVYNRLASITDPRGNAAGFEPPLGGASPERYTTRWLFDYQEGSDPIADVETFDLPLGSIQRGLGDLNGDARTDQAAGNPVRVRAPTMQLPAGSNEAARLGGDSQDILTEQQWNDRGQLVRSIDAEGNVDAFDHFSANDPAGDGAVTSGGLATLTEPTGTRVDSSHDELNRLIQRQISRAVHVTERVYDSLSRVLEEHQDQAIASSVWAGNNRRLALTYPGARRIDFGHESIDRILALNEDSAPITDYTWIGPTHRLLERTHGNNTRLTLLNDAADESIGWDQFRRMVQLRHLNAGGAFVQRLNVYNRADQRLPETRLDQNGLTDRHTYDSLYRVVSSRYDEAGAAGALSRSRTAAATPKPRMSTASSWTSRSKCATPHNRPSQKALITSIKTAAAMSWL